MSEISAEDGARIAEAAHEARLALENWTPNEEPAPEFRVDHAIEVCAEFERSMAEWSDEAIDRLIKLAADLRNAVRGAKDADARFGAQQVMGPIQNLYVEVDLAQKKIEDARLEAQRSAELSLLTDPLSRTELEEDSNDVSAQAERVAKPANRAKFAVFDFEAKAKFDASLFALELLGVKVHIGRLDASLADVKISFKSNDIYRGVVEIAQFKLAKALAALELTQEQLLAAPGTMASDAEAALEALRPLLEPLQEATTEGAVLRMQIEAAIRAHWDGAEPEEEDGPDLTPWPSGMRLLPPVSDGREPEEVELVEVQRFEGHEEHVWGLAALSAGRFVSGGTDAKLRLWEVGKSAPLRVFAGHGDAITRIAALEGRHVVSASTDKTLRLWDLEQAEALRVFEGHDAAVMDVAALSSQRFVSCSEDGAVCLWDRDSGEMLRRWKHPQVAQGVAGLSATRFVSGDFNEPDLCIREVGQDAPAWRSGRDEATLWKAAALSSETFISIEGGPSSHRLMQWERTGSAPSFVLDTASGTCQDVALLSTARAASAHEGGLALWALPGAGETAARLMLQVKAAEALQSVRALPSADPKLGRMIVGGRSGYLAYWEVRAG